MSAENKENIGKGTGGKIINLSEVNTPNDIQNTISETPEVNVLEEVLTILTKKLGTECDIETKTQGGFEQISLYDKDLGERKSNIGQIFVVVKPNGLINVQLNPHYAPQDFYFQMENLDLEKFTRLSSGFQYILNKSSIDQLYALFYQYEQSYKVDLSQYM